MDSNTFTPSTAALQDELTGALIGLARAADTAPAVSDATWQVMAEGLAAPLTNGGLDAAALLALIDRVHGEKFNVVPDCAVCASPCGRTADYDMANIRNAPAEIRTLKTRILSGVRDMAVDACRALALGRKDDEVNRFFAEALATIGEELDATYLQPTLQKTGEMARQCKALLGTTESIPCPAAPENAPQ